MQSRIENDDDYAEEERKKTYTLSLLTRFFSFSAVVFIFTLNTINSTLDDIHLYL